MATRSVSKPSAKPQIKTSLQPITDNDSDVGAVVRMLTRHTYESGQSYNEVGKLTSEELLTLGRSSEQWKASCVNGLEYLAKSMFAHDPKAQDFDANAASWLLQSLTNSLRVADNLHHCATQELQQRGYDWMGDPLPASV
jgi:hypothetical protein